MYDDNGSAAKLRLTYEWFKLWRIRDVNDNNNNNNNNNNSVVIGYQGFPQTTVGPKKSDIQIA